MLLQKKLNMHSFLLEHFDIYLSNVENSPKRVNKKACFPTCKKGPEGIRTPDLLFTRQAL